MTSASPTTPYGLWARLARSVRACDSAGDEPACAHHECRGRRWFRDRPAGRSSHTPIHSWWPCPQVSAPKRRPCSLSSEPRDRATTPRALTMPVRACGTANAERSLGRRWSRLQPSCLGRRAGHSSGRPVPCGSSYRHHWHRGVGPAASSRQPTCADSRCTRTILLSLAAQRGGFERGLTMDGLAARGKARTPERPARQSRGVVA